MIALYGGSFDPVHIGHLRIAEDIREIYNFEKIIFIPAYISPLKTGSFASAEDRLNMLYISIKNNPYFEVSTVEIERKGKSYTIDTINHYKKVLGYNPYFIVGTDAFLTLHLWKKPEELLEKTNFIVVGRGLDTFYNVKSYLEEHFPGTKIIKELKLNLEITGVYFFDCRRIDVSATEIRHRVKENKSIKYLVIDKVEDYIYKKNLYRG
jgi:nicotinate-nucleotide adenylyltransferase